MDIRPQQKFRSDQVSKILKEALTAKFGGQKYEASKASTWTQEIVDEVRLKLKELQLPKYKYVVTAVVGELKGEGLRFGARCMWDTETDGLAQENFTNDSLFCSLAAFAIYYY